MHLKQSWYYRSNTRLYGPLSKYTFLFMFLRVYIVYVEGKKPRKINWKKNLLIPIECVIENLIQVLRKLEITKASEVNEINTQKIKNIIGNSDTFVLHRKFFFLNFKSIPVEILTMSSYSERYLLFCIGPVAITDVTL